MAGLRRAVAGAVHRWRGWRGNVDGVQDGALLGWVALTDPAAGPQEVGLFTARGQIARTLANLPREDLRAAGIGDGRHGFAFPLDAALLRVIAEAGNRVSLRLPGPRPVEIGGWDFAASRRRSSALSAPAAPQTLPQLLYGAVARLEALHEDTSPLPGSVPPRLERHARMLAPRDLIPGPGVPGPDAALPPLMTAYADYTRYRCRQDGIFPIAGPDAPACSSHEAEHFLHWYLSGYSGMRAGLRVPLSAAQIAHLNAPVLIGGQRQSLTRATWMFLHRAPPVLHGMDFASRDWVSGAIYWWAINQAKALHVEDCLVPPAYVGHLLEVPEAHVGQDWAPSEFLLRLRNEAPALLALDLAQAGDRRQLMLAALTLSVERPDYLRYLPAGSVEALLAPAADGGPSALAEFLAGMGADGSADGGADRGADGQGGAETAGVAGDRPQPPAKTLAEAPAELPGAAAGAAAAGAAGPATGPATGPAIGPAPAEAAGGAAPAGPAPQPAGRTGPGARPALTRAAFARALRRSGFDLERAEFLAFTPEGHRFEAARLPAPQGAPVDVQVIGPFEKASGLGQATRLSAAALEQGAARAGLTLNCVDFDLDNPAPEGFSHVGRLGRYRPARVNLLHLNAESIPLAFAYQPDVFSGAYNIGYFFWELDSPAACHYLALDLLDEVWVSSRYGVGIYRPHTRLPVSNVGMCYEEPPAIDRAEARAFLEARAGVRAGEFAFLVTFDSFSFVQRKNPLGPVRAFLAAFPRGAPGARKVRLVLKSQNRRRVGDPVQHAIWQELEKLIADDPRIAVIDETLSYDDLLRLKKGADAYVSLHRSEGWGFGMIEAMALGVPVLATGYSGNMAFCSDATAFLVDYTEVELAPDDYIFVRPGQKWAEPDLAHAARQLRALREDAALREARVAAALANVRQNFSAPAIGARYAARLGEILARREGQGAGAAPGARRAG